MASITLTGIEKSYGNVSVINVVDLSVEKGEFVAWWALPAAASPSSRAWSRGWRRSAAATSPSISAWSTTYHLDMDDHQEVTVSLSGMTDLRCEGAMTVHLASSLAYVFDAESGGRVSACARRWATAST